MSLNGRGTSGRSGRGTAVLADDAAEDGPGRLSSTGKPEPVTDAGEENAALPATGRVRASGASDWARGRRTLCDTAVGSLVELDAELGVLRMLGVLLLRGPGRGP